MRDGFTSLRSGLNDSFTVEREDDDCDDRGYVRGRFASVTARSTASDTSAI